MRVPGIRPRFPSGAGRTIQAIHGLSLGLSLPRSSPDSSGRDSPTRSGHLVLQATGLVTGDCHVSHALEASGWTLSGKYVRIAIGAPTRVDTTARVALRPYGRNYRGVVLGNRSSQDIYGGFSIVIVYPAFGPYFPLRSPGTILVCWGSRQAAKCIRQIEN